MVLSDKNTYQQVLGGLMKNPLLLVDNDIRKEDFDLRIAKIVFTTIQQLFENGAESLTPFEIDTEIEKHEGTYNLYKQDGGLEYVQNCYEYSASENFKVYYERLKKFSLLRILKKNNYDISRYYGENLTIREENEAIQNLDDDSIEEILDNVEAKFTEIRSNFIMGEKKDGDISFGLREMIEGFSSAPDIGPAINGSIFNTAIRGARPGIFLLRSCATNVGKAIPNYTIIPMADGTWKKVEDVKVGDKLIGSDGNPTTVTAVYPQKDKKKVWRIYFKDGRVAECCEEHLWTYFVGKRNILKTTSLKELNEYIKKYSLQDNDGGYRIKVPMVNMINYSEKTYSISPYVMGLILGDGSFRYSKSNKSFCFSSSDKILPETIAKEFNCVAVKNSEKNYSWTFTLKNCSSNKKKLWVEDILKSYPDLWNKKSEDKYIPEDYLIGSYQQRLELLQGLMDTDGCINTTGTTTFTTVSKNMALQIQRLCYSLGFSAKIHEDFREKYSLGVAYRVELQLCHSDKPKLFKLNRKKERAEQYANKKRIRYERKDKNPIVKIEETDRYEWMTCFTVDAPDALFCINDYILTHNTRLAVFDSVKLCFPVRWSFERGTFIREVEKDGEPREPRKTLFITTEMDEDEIKTILVANIAGVNEEHILTATYDLGERERVSKAMDIIEEYKDYYFITKIGDPNLLNVSATIKKFVKVKGVEYVFFDYIFTSPSLISQFSAAKIREDVALGMMSNELKQIAADNHIFIASSTQVNAKGMEEDTFKDESCIRGARSVAD